MSSLTSKKQGQSTPGPWYWHEDSNGRLSLRTPDRGQLIVMDFARQGMQAAEPRFAHWDGITEGEPRGRRGGILKGEPEGHAGVHPDARLIASAPDLLAAANAVLAHFMPTFPDSRAVDDCLVQLAAAVAKAEL